METKDFPRKGTIEAERTFGKSEETSNVHKNFRERQDAAEGGDSTTLVRTSCTMVRAFRSPSWTVTSLDHANTPAAEASIHRLRYVQWGVKPVKVKHRAREGGTVRRDSYMIVQSLYSDLRVKVDDTERREFFWVAFTGEDYVRSAGSRFS